jgi:hypothetical protein
MISAFPWGEEYVCKTTKISGYPATTLGHKETYTHIMRKKKYTYYNN